MIKQVAELQGRTVTDFVVVAAQEAAYRAIEQDAVFRLSKTDQEIFAETLMLPTKQSPALKRALIRRRNLLRTE